MVDELKTDIESSYEDGDDDLVDLISSVDSDDSEEHATSIRPDIIERVYRTLSADAQRGNGELSRGDVNRAYIRKELSIAECMEVEDRMIAAGFHILDDAEDDETEAEGDEATGQRRAYRYLNETEEKNLGRQIQLGLRLPKDTTGLDQTYVDHVRNDAERARAIFVATNVRYVEKLARRRGQHRHLSLEDIMQEGFIGLLHAADLYDPERGFRFKTYATWWIEQRMRRAISNDDRLIRLPVHIHEKVSKIRRARAKLKLTYGRPPTTDELAVAIGMEPERLMKLLWRVQTTDCSEGDEPIGDDATVLSLIASPTESQFDVVLYQELQERFRDVLATLTPQEERIVRMRFGIELDREHTLASVGELYNVTRERIRQIEARALKKLRHPARSDKLSDFLDS